MAFKYKRKNNKIVGKHKSSAKELWLLFFFFLFLRKLIEVRRQITRGTKTPANLYAIWGSKILPHYLPPTLHYSYTDVAIACSGYRNVSPFSVYLNFEWINFSCISPHIHLIRYKKHAVERYRRVDVEHVVQKQHLTLSKATFSA